jgi:phosphomannomutase/phosphoglucomutase
MSRLKAIVLGGEGEARPGGTVTRITGLADRYVSDLVQRFRLDRPLRVVAACGNGTAGAFAPRALRAMGAEVIEMDCDLDYNFPRYNPNPEDHAMLRAMAEAVRANKADVALGFDGDGDRCGVVDDEGEEIFADKIGLMLARDLSARHEGARFVVDVKSTGLYETDPVLKANGATTLYWKTGHSYIKRKTAEEKALAGFEKSGHFFFREPLGLGYDDGLVAAGAVLSMLARSPGARLSQMRRDLPPAYTSLTMSPHCADDVKYGVVEAVAAEYEALFAAGGQVLGRAITHINRINGVRVGLADGSWVLVRASSNKPELVVVVESLNSLEDMRALFRDEVKPRLARRPEVGAYNQEV